MFSPVYAGPRAKQPVTFLASLSLQGVLVALLCLMPPPKSHQCCLRKDDLRAAAVTPIYFQPPAPPVKPAPKLAAPDPNFDLAGAAKPLETEVPPVEANVAEPVAEPAAAEAAAAAAETETAAAGGEGGGGVAPFPAWQMSSNTGAHGFHHQVSQALPVYTPEPPILRGDFPETARGKEVVMVVVINEEGAIAAFKVVQGVGNGVERTIVETLKRWVYVPAKFNGRAIASQQELRFHFPG